MTLTELRYVVTLAREKHFGRAAERCHVSQPTLSVAVKKLEDELESATQQQQKLVGEVEEARQVHLAAHRALQKIDLALEEILTAKLSFENQVEEAETEDAFGKGRRSLA